MLTLVALLIIVPLLAGGALAARGMIVAMQDANAECGGYF